MNIVCTGGTASGKTSFLNVLCMFIPPTERILSIEDTREIQLPPFLHWVPLTTRPPNIEGKGEVTMLQLMINALRMRPDRMIVGEIRRSKEAEVLFEAINTGHSVYSTLHANTAEETLKRLINPPINIPISLLTSLQLIAVMHRDRRKRIRRVLEVSELIPSGGLDEMKIEMNDIFRWVPSKDQIVEWGKSNRVWNDIKLFSGMDDNEIKRNLEEKKNILLWMVKNKMNTIEKVGKIISDYYKNPESVLKMISQK
jgi:flagellar protein FlaI